MPNSGACCAGPTRKSASFAFLLRPGMAPSCSGLQREVTLSEAVHGAARGFTTDCQAVFFGAYAAKSSANR